MSNAYINIDFSQIDLMTLHAPDEIEFTGDYSLKVHGTNRDDYIYLTLDSACDDDQNIDIQLSFKAAKQLADSLSYLTEKLEREFKQWLNEES